MVLDSSDGWPAENVFEGAQAGYTFDDIVLMPGRISFDISDIDVGCQLTKRVRLKMPLISGPVDTVTEAAMAASLALVGGIGFVHCNQSIKSQVEMLKRAKRFVSGFILEPITLRPDHTLKEVDKIKSDKGISGICITENGNLGSKLVGFVSSRDTEMITDRGTKISEVMIKRVVRGMEPMTIEEAVQQLKQARVGKLPIVNSEGRLTSMVTRADIKKLRDFPRMSRDLHGQLLAGARVIADSWNDSGAQPAGGALDRASTLAEAGADILYIDPCEASNDGQLKLIQAVKQSYPMVDIVAGPVVSCREAKRLVEAGADALVVGGGQARGSAFGRADASALFEVAKYVLQNYGDRTVIAGGDLRNAGHVLKALSLGASAVMLSEPFAGTNEAPGRNFVRDGDVLKGHHPPMAGEPLPAMRHSMTKGAVVGSRSRLPREVFPRELGAAVHCHGSVRQLAPYIMQGVRHGMRDLGQRSIAELHTALHAGDLRLEVLTPNAAHEREAHRRALQAAPHPEVMPTLTDLSISVS